MRRSVSPDDGHIVDTVVLLYFLLVDKIELLCDLIGRPLQVPVAVYDPEDRTSSTGTLPRPELLSEMRRSVRHYELLTASGGDTVSLRRVAQIDSLYDDAVLKTISMSSQEQGLAAQLQSTGAGNFGLRIPLGPGEAACIAISLHRGWTIVTDDTDAFRVLDRFHGGSDYPFERIRKLLIRAAGEHLISALEANRIHAEMRTRGFWDSGIPFP